jgi:hypothetical protein
LSSRDRELDRLARSGEKDVEQAEMVPCRAKNVINNPLVDRDRILFPPLHIKLGLIKQFTKALNKESGWWLLPLFVPGFPRINYREIKSWHL